MPLSELITERKARQALERTLETERTTSRSQFDTLNARIDQLIANQKPTPQQPQPAQPAKKESWDDPDGYVANVETSLDDKFTRKFVNADLARTHRTEGERFVKAYNELTERAKTEPGVAAEVRRILPSGTPVSGYPRLVPEAGSRARDWRRSGEVRRDHPSEDAR